MIPLHVAPALAGAAELADILGWWDWRADVVGVLVAVGGVYVTGWTRLRRRNPAATGVFELALYVIGLLAVALALLSPIDAGRAAAGAAHGAA